MYKKINYVDIPDSHEELGINIQKEPLILNVEVEIEKKIENILILGVDSKENKYSFTRSDVIMILSIDFENKSFKLSSVMRDSYLNIPDVKYFDKVNHAYAFGGGLYSLRTINSNLDLDCESFITVDFEAVEEIIDDLAGVEIDVDRDELAELNSCLRGLNGIYNDNVKLVDNIGIVNLNGRQAVAYSRIRHNNGGDSQRTQRQREVVVAIFEKFKKMSIVEINSMVDDVLPLVSMSLSEKELFDYLIKVNQYKSYDMDIYRFPQNYYGSKYKGVYYAFPDSLTEEVSKLHEFIYGDDDYIASEIVKSHSENISSIITELK
jgi:LCP family protein required for cell wall assembly